MRGKIVNEKGRLVGRSAQREKPMKNAKYIQQKNGICDRVLIGLLELLIHGKIVKVYGLAIDILGGNPSGV